MSIEVVAFLMRPDLYDPYVSLHRDSHCVGLVEPLMTVTQHHLIVTSLKQEHDRLEKFIEQAFQAHPNLDIDIEYENERA